MPRTCGYRKLGCKNPMSGHYVVSNKFSEMGHIRTWLPYFHERTRLLMFGKYQRERGIRRKHAAVIVAATRYDDCLMAHPISLVHVPAESDAAGQSGRPLRHR